MNQELNAQEEAKPLEEEKKWILLSVGLWWVHLNARKTREMKIARDNRTAAQAGTICAGQIAKKKCNATLDRQGLPALAQLVGRRPLARAEARAMKAFKPTANLGKRPQDVSLPSRARRRLGFSISDLDANTSECELLVKGSSSAFVFSDEISSQLLVFRPCGPLKRPGKSATSSALP